MLEIGLKCHAEGFVSENLTAINIGSGDVPVFATAMMIALMEHACQNEAKKHLPEGQDTVGIHVNVSHCSATPVGMKVRAEGELVEIDRRRLVFKVAAYDEKGLIGEGLHERFIIDVEKFRSKTLSKLD